jgi:hypothetical protein
VYSRRSLALPIYSDSDPQAGLTMIKAAHIMQLRAAVLALQ